MNFRLTSQWTPNNASNRRSPNEARAASHRDFGNLLQVAEDTRAAWGWTTFEQWMQDLRYGRPESWKASRLRRRHSAHTGVGIGATTAIFSIAMRHCFRSLPYAEPDRMGGGLFRESRAERRIVDCGPADFRDWREQSKSFKNISGNSGTSLSLRVDERPETNPRLE
jgi:hypothetical protein